MSLLNTTLARGTSVEIVDVLCSAVPTDMWGQRTRAFFDALVPALVWQRDTHHVALDTDRLRRALTLDIIQSLVDTPDLGLSRRVRGDLSNYLASLPGHPGSVQRAEMHAYIVMPIFGLLKQP